MAIAEVASSLEHGYEWLVDPDLETFFNRANHQRLLARLRRWLSNRRLLPPIRTTLRAKIAMPGGVVAS